MRLQEMFDQADGEFLKFDRVENKLSNRPDLHGFMLLDKLCPGSGDIIDAAEHDEIYLSVNISELQAAVTQEQVVELHRCGIRYSSSYDCLTMFV